MNVTLNPADVVSGGMAECYLTLDGRRYLMMMARDFKATLKKRTEKVPVLGRVMMGHKTVGAEGKFSMTIYKVTSLFDEMCRKYKESGVDPTFDISVTVHDPESSVGSDSKIFRDCILSGDVVLSGLSADADLLEQKVEGYFDDFESYETFTNPRGM